MGGGGVAGRLRVAVASKSEIIRALWSCTLNNVSAYTSLCNYRITHKELASLIAVW